MRFCAVQAGGATRIAISDPADGVHLITPEVGDLRELIPAIMGGDQIDAEQETIEDPQLVAPLIPGKIVAIGLNYRDHASESQVEPPERPLVFAKFPSSIIGPGEPIVVDRAMSSRVDWEVELAAVVGRRARNIRAEEALEYLLGYTIANDVSARDIQFGDGQWTRGKSLDTFCPLGPEVVTMDEIGPGDDLRLFTTVSGERMQDDSTRSMIFGVPELLEFCSRSFTLEPGDILLTGTPSGCGEFMDPQRFLLPGDVVEVGIDGIGLLSNPVVAPAGTAGSTAEGGSEK